MERDGPQDEVGTVCSFSMKLAELCSNIRCLSYCAFLRDHTLEGTPTPPGKTRRPSACSETQRGAKRIAFSVVDGQRVLCDHTGAGQLLTVRLLIPSEKAPICLTVPSESSICDK